MLKLNKTIANMFYLSNIYSKTIQNMFSRIFIFLSLRKLKNYIYPLEKKKQNSNVFKKLNKKLFKLQFHTFFGIF